MPGWLRLLAGRRQDVPGLPSDVHVVRGAWIPALGGWLCGSKAPAAAVALGSTIIVHPRVALTEPLLRHELAHVRQWRRQPFSFPWRYAWYHVCHGYRANPFEIEAREAE